MPIRRSSVPLIIDAIKASPSKRNSDKSIGSASYDKDNITKSNKVIKGYISQVDEFISRRKKSH